MNVELPFTLHPNQRLIHESPALYKVAKCGKRFGKSRWAIFALIQAAGNKPGGVFWYVSPTYRQGKNIAWREFKNLIPHKYVRRMIENELLIELVNGASIQIIGADNEDSLRGPKLDGCVLDECAYINKYIWNNVLRGQLLGSNGEKPGFAWFISSPINPTETMGRKLEDWYPEFYNEALRKQMSGDKNWAAWHFSIYDNPTLSRDQIDDIRNDNTDDAWNVEYLANESAFAGHVYSEFNFSKHVREYVPSKESVLVRMVDWGIAHPTVCLFAYVDNINKKIYFEDEYVKSDHTIEESCDVIKKKTMDRAVEWTVCDPSLHKRNSITGVPDILEFNKNGVPCIAGDNNKRGYNIVKMFLKKDSIIINPKCRILIKQFRELQWTDKVNDDCSDAARYGAVRIHDLMFKWKDAEPVKIKPYSFNLNDVQLFKGRTEYKSPVLEEINAY